MEFELTILGVSGAVPAHGRFPTSQYLNIQNHHFLIDCGEGTQMRIDEYGVPRSKLNHIFISHLHGDHIFGLPGLLFSFALSNRLAPLHIFSPAGLEDMIKAQLMPGGKLPYPLIFHPISTTTSQLIFENDELSVSTIPLAHRIPTAGFLFREKPFERNIIPEKITAYSLSIPQIVRAKNGEDVHLDNGEVIKNTELTFPPYQPRSYAFVSDTQYHEVIVPQLNGVDLLYHETTFCDNELANAIATQHSTARQAATIAKLAGVKTLITGHYSSRYAELAPFLQEATAIFPNTVLGLEGKKYTVKRYRADDEV